MRRIIGLKGKEAKEVLQGKAHCLDRQSNITMLLSQTMRWEGHVAHTEGKTNSYWILKDFKDKDVVK
jgi:hypothetical protein